MEQIISLIVANGVFAVLFCGLLVYELRDSRARERRYNATIRALTERLEVVKSVKSDTTDIKTDVGGISLDVKAVRADADRVKRAVVGGRKACGNA